MGAGIAQVCAQAGWQTNLYDAFPEGLERGMDRIAAFWEKGIARGKTTPEQRDSWAANLTAVDDLAAAVDEADLVIEAVPELPDLKHSIFAELDKLAPAHAILGTNTSSLSIADIAAATSRPEKVIGMHFFNPVPIMKLLELVRHEHTSESTVAAAQEASQAMGKTSIVVRDVPGFATSRLGVVLGNEAIRMLADGVASAKDIDTAMVLGYKHPMGPLALTDLVGSMFAGIFCSTSSVPSMTTPTHPTRCWSTLWPRDGSARKQERGFTTGRAGRQKKLTSVGFETNIKYDRGEI